MLLYLSVFLLLSQINTHEKTKYGGKNIANDIKASIRSALNPIVIYINSFEAPTEEEISYLIDDFSKQITIQKVFLVMGKSLHFIMNEAYKYSYPYYNKYSIKTIKSLREFFDGYSGQTIYNPWVHLRDFKQGKSKNFESIILSLSIIILVFLFNKRCYISFLIFMCYFLYVYAFKSITTLFYLYVTIFSPVLALIAIFQDHSFIAIGFLFSTYIIYIILRKFTKTKIETPRSSIFKDSQISALHSDAIIDKLNQLEKNFNKISERLARLEKINKKK